MQAVETSETQIPVGLLLKIARLKAALRQYELAARVGISATMLSEIETGRRKVAQPLLDQIWEAIRAEGKEHANDQG